MTTLIQTLLKRSDLDYATFTDPVSKFRVSTPESLIDSDFEYGLQGIKWETLHLVNNIPLFFSRSGDTPISLSNVTIVTGTNYVTVTTTGTHGLLEGSPIYISGLKSVSAEGFFPVLSVVRSNQFVYKARYNQTIPTGSIFDANTSYLFPGMVYQGTALNARHLEYVQTDQATNSFLEVKMIPNYSHGFAIGTTLTLSGSSGRRTVGFGNTNVTGNFIDITNHNLYTGMQVTYTPDSGGAIASLQQNSSSLYVIVQTKDRIGIGSSLTSLDASIISLGTVPLNTPNHRLTSTDKATDNVYTVNNIIDSERFTMQANNVQVDSNVIMFDYQQNVVQRSTGGTVFITSNANSYHNLYPASPIVYRQNGSVAITGLTNNATYYVVRWNECAFGLATTRANAIAKTANVNVTLPVNTSPAGTTYSFGLQSLLSEFFGVGTISCSNNSTLVTGTGVNFLSYFKRGDPFVAVPSTAAVVSYQVTAPINADNIVLTGFSGTLNSVHQLRYRGITYANFINNTIYYIRVITAPNTVRIFQTIANATANTSQLTTTGIATTNAFETIPVFNKLSILEGVVQQVHTNTMLTLRTANTAGNFINCQYFVSSGLYPFSDSYVYHRAHDGGIELNPSNNVDAQIIRQTRKYFRYQPGKGIQCSLSVNFSPFIEIDYLSRVGSTASVRTRKPHRLSNGILIRVTGANQSQWNGSNYVVSNAQVNTFDYSLNPANLPSETVATGTPLFTVQAWQGSSLRAGLYDDQNGMFFEYNGLSMYAVRRDATTQLSGLVNVVFDSAVVTKTSDTNTSFLSQLVLKDMIVIRGQTYKVVRIVNNDTIHIQPPYRGVSDENVLISKITDMRVPQTDWSVDPCDGTGPTGYVLDPNKIQMIYLDFSWYGAGKIRFGFKDTKGEVRYVHEFLHNNVFNYAYFRSGNLPARYEVNNNGLPTWVPPLMHWGIAIIMDGRYDNDKAYLFTASGNVLNFVNGDRISVTARITSTTQTTLVYDPYSQTTVSAYKLTTDNAVSGSRWSDVQNIKPGTVVTSTATPNGLPAGRVVTVGTPQKNDTNPLNAEIFIDRQPTQVISAATVYTFGETTDVIPNIIPLVSIRVAPSVDSSITGPLGVRELVNKMQLRLRSVDVLTTNDTELRVILNGFLSNRTFVKASSPSLCEFISHAKGDTIQDGSVMFSYRVPGGQVDSSGKKTTTCTSYDISQLGDMGNSIQGGDNAYPDGPDVLTICAICLDSAGVSATTPYTVSARISWAEAQA